MSVNIVITLPQDKYPRILFLADEIPQSKNAGSIQFLRIFQNYPIDKILIVGRKPLPGAEILGCVYKELIFKISDRVRLSSFHKIIPNLEAMGLLRYMIPRKLKKKIDEFDPELVVTIMQLYSYYATAYAYAVAKKKPLYIFCHDDVEDFSGVSSSLRSLLERKNEKIYSYASKRLCISPQMAIAWQKKYGVPGEVFYPIPDKNIVPRPLEQSSFLKQNGILTLGYAGSLAYGYAEAILEIISVLERTGAILKIYNKTTKILTEDISPNIQFYGYAATALITWQKIQEECDIVILPYSKEVKYKKLYETHFPSKLVDYYSLGMPVIVTGPEYATGYQYNKKNNYPVATGLDEITLLLRQLTKSGLFRRKTIAVPFHGQNVELFNKTL